MSRQLKVIGFLSFVFLISVFLVACPFPSGMHPETPGTTATTGSITGKVVAQGQADNSGVTVTAELTDGIKSVSVQKMVSSRQAFKAVIAAQATTDANGSYTLTGLPAGVYTLGAVGKDGLTKAVTTSVTVSAGSTAQALLMILTQTGQIKGTVTLHDGQDPTGIVVFIAGTSYSAMSDLNGNYLMSYVPAGKNYTLVASKAGYVSEIRPVDVTVNKTTLMESIELQPYVAPQTTGSVSGTATLKGTTTHAGIFVYLVGTSYICVTDANGKFSLTGVAPDGYTIMASKEGYSAQTDSVTVEKEKDARISFTLTPLGPYFVIYDCNCNEGTGSVPIDQTNYLPGYRVTVLDSGSLTKPGHSFAGWNTEAAGTGTTYTQGQTFVMGASNTTLYAVWIEGSTGPAAPTGVTATAVSTTEIEISWSAAAGATSYNLYLSTTPGVSKASYTTKVAGVTSPSRITELILGTTYYGVVTAVSPDGESTESAQVSATPAPYINATIVVNAADGASFMEQVMVLTSRSGSPIAGATVEANGTLFQNTGKRYEGNLTIAKGAAVTLTVTVSGVAYTASATQFSEYPTVSAPTPDMTWQRGSAHTISWSGGSPTTGAYYLVGVGDGRGSSVYGDHGHPYIVPISTTSASVPANTLTTTPPYVVTVGIVNGTMSGSGEITGGTSIRNALPGSAMLVGGMNVIPITVDGSEAAPEFVGKWTETINTPIVATITWTLTSTTLHCFLDAGASGTATLDGQVSGVDETLKHFIVTYTSVTNTGGFVAYENPGDFVYALYELSGNRLKVEGNGINVATFPTAFSSNAIIFEKYFISFKFDGTPVKLAQGVTELGNVPTAVVETNVQNEHVYDRTHINALLEELSMADFLGGRGTSMDITMIGEPGTQPPPARVEPYNFSDGVYEIHNVGYRSPDFPYGCDVYFPNAYPEGQGTARVTLTMVQGVGGFIEGTFSAIVFESSSSGKDFMPIGAPHYITEGVFRVKWIELP